MIKAKAMQLAPSVCLISPDAVLRDAVRATLATAGVQNVTAMESEILAITAFDAVDVATLIIIDLDATRRDHLIQLQKLTSRIAGRAPIIVLTETFDDAVARWFLQIRVSDFLRKPVRMDELLRCCVKAMRDSGPAVETRARVSTFVPAAGGVGATTLAVEAAIQLTRAGATAGETVCLVDLDFSGNACADALDLEPRLDFAEIGASGERLDAQLMEVMLSRHNSGVGLLSARGQLGDVADTKPAAVARLLDVAAARFDHLVIDLPRAWTPFTDDVMAGSDRLFVVTDMTVPGLRSARRLVECIKQRGATSVEPAVIVNRFQQAPLFARGGLRRTDVERALGAHFAGAVANNYALVREAIDRGVPLDSIKPRSNVSLDLKRILFAA